MKEEEEEKFFLGQWNPDYDPLQQQQEEDEEEEEEDH